jgi:hypothetical protein
MSDGRAYSAPFVTLVPEHSGATVDMPTPGTLPLLVTGLISSGEDEASGSPGPGVPGLPIWIDKSLERSLYPVSAIDSAVNRSTRIQTIRMPVIFQLQEDRSLLLKKRRPPQR